MTLIVLEVLQHALFGRVQYSTMREAVEIVEKIEIVDKRDKKR